MQAPFAQFPTSKPIVPFLTLMFISPFDANKVLSTPAFNKSPFSRLIFKAADDLMFSSTEELPITISELTPRRFTPLPLTLPCTVIPLRPVLISSVTSLLSTFAEDAIFMPVPLFSSVNFAPALVTIPETFIAPPLLITSIAPPALASLPEISIPLEPSLVIFVSPFLA